jgi:hypothetical protein
VELIQQQQAMLQPRLLLMPVSVLLLLLWRHHTRIVYKPEVSQGYKKMMKLLALFCSAAAEHWLYWLSSPVLTTMFASLREEEEEKMNSTRYHSFLQKRRAILDDHFSNIDHRVQHDHCFVHSI